MKLLISLLIIMINLSMLLSNELITLLNKVSGVYDNISTITDEIINKNQLTNNSTIYSSIYNTLSKTILMTSCNHGFLNHLINFDCHCKKLGLKYIVISMDSRLHNYLLENTTIISYSMIGGHVGDVTTDSTEFRSKAFNLITVKKKEAVRMVLQLGYHVLFADTDVVITRNPFTYILWPQVDYVHSLNSVCVKDDTWNFYRNREEGNTGFYFARSNNNTIKLWESAIKASNNYPKLDDQAIFWNVIRHTIDPIIIPLGKCNKLSFSDHMNNPDKLTTCHLDPCIFSAGMISKVYIPEYTYEELITNLRYLNETICTLHANYIKGNRNKMIRMNEYGFWLAVPNQPVYLSTPLTSNINENGSFFLDNDNVKYDFNALDITQSTWGKCL